MGSSFSDEEVDLLMLFLLFFFFLEDFFFSASGAAATADGLFIKRKSGKAEDLSLSLAEAVWVLGRKKLEISWSMQLERLLDTVFLWVLVRFVNIIVDCGWVVLRTAALVRKWLPIIL